jgi:hypothetical protein
MLTDHLYEKITVLLTVVFFAMYVRELRRLYKAHHPPAGTRELKAKRAGAGS